jgi:hypothetical protein
LATRTICASPRPRRRPPRRAGNPRLPKPPTFGKVADAYFEAKKGEYRNDKYREMVRVALTRTLQPLRPLPIASIDTEAVLAALKPVWDGAPETGKRLREKVAAVLDVAAAKGYRSGENPARWKGHLEHLLPKRQKVEKAHHAALFYADAPAFMTWLLAEDVMGAKALAFCILTAARSGVSAVTRPPSGQLLPCMAKVGVRRFLS